MLNILEALGPFTVGVLFLVGLVAIPVSLFLVLLQLKKSKEVKEEIINKENEAHANSVKAELEYQLNEESKIILVQQQNGLWEPHYQVGSHKSKLEVAAKSDAAQVFWETLNYLRVPRTLA